MALKKEIVLDSGVITKYHRIVSINNVTNVCSIIEVASYTSEEKRNEEMPGESRVFLFAVFKKKLTTKVDTY